MAEAGAFYPRIQNCSETPGVRLYTEKTIDNSLYRSLHLFLLIEKTEVQKLFGDIG